MKTIIGTYYKCEFCGKLYTIKRFADKHHLRCRKDPKNKSPCLEFCKHLKKSKEEVGCYSNHTGDSLQTINIFKCTKKDIFIKPRWANDIDLYFCDLPEIEKMPLKCKSYKEDTFI